MKAKFALSIAVILVFAGSLISGKAVYYYSKGLLAQLLLNRAWEKSRTTGLHVKAWSWADTYAVGRLKINSIGMDHIVLDGVHNEALAFGPGLAVNQKGVNNLLIAGHRDSFFKSLQDVSLGDSILLELSDGEKTFSVTDISITDAGHAVIPVDCNGKTLSLVTCYPFEITGDAPLRYIVTGIQIL